MFKRAKSPPPLLTPSPASESHPRNPRVHRQSGIPSINRPRGLSGAVVASEMNTTPRAPNPSATKTLYQHLSREPNLLTSTPSSHRRIVSMPQPLPSVIQAQIDIDGDRIARGLISPPIVDFTRFDDRYRGPRKGNFEGLVTRMKKTNRRSASIKPILKRNPHSGVIINDNTILDPHPASTRKPDPRLIVSTLELVVLDSHKKPADVLDVYDLLGMHQLDQLDFEEREIARGNGGQSRTRGVMVVFGEPLRKASIYASTTMVLGGREHELPIIVVSCIEELYRTGIYQSNLFRTLPNRSRLLELINIFDSEQQPPGSIIRSRQSLPSKNSVVNSGFGANTSLHLESTPDICALLSTYLSALPEPILLPALFRPIWDWCGLDEDDVDALELKPRISSVSLSRTHTNPMESSRILIAQLVLHLLPSPHFSLLVYILAFFSQVAMVHEENGVGMGDLSRMFGGRIFGGGQSRRRKLSAEIAREDPHQPRMEGEVMMLWFLRRWSMISEGLFDVIEDAKMGVFSQEEQHQQYCDGLRSFEKPIQLEDPPLDSGEIPNHSSGRDTPFRLPVLDDVPCSGESPNKVTPRPHHDESSLSNSKNTAADELAVVDSDKSLDCVDDRSLDESFNILIANTDLDGKSIYSATDLDERLLDVSMPTLLGQTFPIGPFNEDDDDDSSRFVVPRTEIAKPGDDNENVNANDIVRQRIKVLEAEVERSNKAATESLQELSKEKMRRTDLENRIKELELALEMERKKKTTEKIYDDDYQGDDKSMVLEGGYCEKMLEIAKKERDDALDLVREIRKLMVKD